MLTVEEEVRSNIDWMCDPAGAGDGPPSRLRFFKEPVLVGMGLIPAIRGPISAPMCVNYAVLYGWFKRKEAALSWLKAGQAHNPEVKALFDANADYAIQYAVDAYSDQAATKFGTLYSGADTNWLSNRKGFLQEKEADLSKIPFPQPESWLNDDDLNPPRPRPGTMGDEHATGGGRPGH